MPAAREKSVTPSIKWPALLLGLLAGLAYSGSSSAMKVLVFSKVQDGAYRHSSIPNGITAIHEIVASKGWQVDDTVDARAFNVKNLAQYDVIIWNNTGGVVLNDEQQRAFQKFIHNGGGYVGIHMAAAGTFVDGGSTCSEPDWPWFAQLVGAQFKFHPQGTPAGKLLKNTAEHLGLDGLPDPWLHEDEWYEWAQNPADNPNIKVLLWVDESSYSNKTGKHPVSWYQEFEGGRAFYTALGHTEESFNEENFRKHLAGGIEWASAHSPNLVKHARSKRSEIKQ